MNTIAWKTMLIAAKILTICYRFGIILFYAMCAMMVSCSATQLIHPTDEYAPMDPALQLSINVTPLSRGKEKRRNEVTGEFHAVVKEMRSAILESQCILLTPEAPALSPRITQTVVDSNVHGDVYLFILSAFIYPVSKTSDVIYTCAWELEGYGTLSAVSVRVLRKDRFSLISPFAVMGEKYRLRSSVNEQISRHFVNKSIGIVFGLTNLEAYRFAAALKNLQLYARDPSMATGLPESYKPPDDLRELWTLRLAEKFSIQTLQLLAGNGMLAVPLEPVAERRIEILTEALSRTRDIREIAIVCDERCRAFEYLECWGEALSDMDYLLKKQAIETLGWKQALCRRAHLYLQAGLLAEGIRDCNSGLEYYPEDPDLWTVRAGLYLAAGDLDTAMNDLLNAEYLGHAMSCDFEMYSALSALFHCHPNEALRRAQNTVLCDSNRILPRLIAAYALLALGDVQQAKKQYDAYLATDPKCTEIKRWFSVDFMELFAGMN